MNNNDVIEYIRQNSKHTHAELIAEWLLTGCEVIFLDEALGERFTCENPSWLPERKYLLVKRKPAYRVFKLFKRTTSTVDRYENGTYSENYNENLEWISDWIEYDPDPTPKWPDEYIQRIAEIDQSAAQWIVDNIDPNEADLDHLSSMFTWSESPQGHDYWENIYQTLNASKLASS